MSGFGFDTPNSGFDDPNVGLDDQFAIDAVSSNITDTTFAVLATSYVDGVCALLVTGVGAPKPDDPAFDSSSEKAIVSSGVQFSITHHGAVQNTQYQVWLQINASGTRTTQFLLITTQSTTPIPPSDNGEVQMSNLGLPVNAIVNVGVVIGPQAAQVRNFGSLLILGDSNVIDTIERLRPYEGIDAIASDLGTDSPEYKAAQVYYAQSPQPQLCYIGKWSRVATSGLLRGGVLSSADQALGNFTAVTTGSLRINVDGVAQAVTGINLSTAVNLNGAAAILQASLTGVTVIWDANNARFVVSSGSTGPSSSIDFADAPSSGVDIAPLFGLREADGGYLAQGTDSETLLSAVQTLASMSNDWYGLDVASSVAPSDNDYLAVASFIESTSVSRIFGLTIQNAAALDRVSTTDLAAVLASMNIKRTFTQYCSSNAHADDSIFGRAFTVDFQGQNTTITLKFKQEPTITPESLTVSQASALKAKNCNVFVKYNNDTAILQEGVMCNGYFFDEVHGLDWLQNDLQTDIFNLLYTSTTKIPQTDPGINRIVARLTARLDQAVTNGLVAPGVWNGPDIGALKSGDTLSTGFYVYAPPVASQSQADREARKAPVIQIAVKLAGAVHFSDIIVNVNR